MKDGSWFKLPLAMVNGEFGWEGCQGPDQHLYSKASMKDGSWFKLPLAMVNGELAGKAARAQTSTCIERLL